MSHHFKRYHTHSRGYRPRRHRGRLRVGRLILLVLIFAAIIFGIVLGVMFLTKTGFFAEKDASASVPAEIPAGYEAPVQTAEAEALPAAVDATQPAAFGLASEIEQDGTAATGFARAKTIAFPIASDYTPLSGVVTANGNNYRNTRSYGGFSAGSSTLEKAWPLEGGLSASAAQPLAVSWDDDMRQMMNLYPEKSAKEGLVEVLIPGSGGTLSFVDLADGSATRDPIVLGFTPGSAMSLDPRGYPLLYIGGNAENACMNIYSLISGELLYKYGGEKDSFSLLDSQEGFSCAPLVAADADVLVWAGENGLLYTMNLNSDFDRAAGTVSVSPDTPVKYRYTATGGADGASSASFGITGLAAWRSYAFITDDGGYIQCIDLNTMTPVYVQKTKGGIVSSTLIEEAADGSTSISAAGRQTAAPLSARSRVSPVKSSGSAISPAARRAASSRPRYWVTARLAIWSFAQSRRERAKMRSSLRSRQIPARSNGSTAQAGRPLSLPRQDIRPTEPASCLRRAVGTQLCLTAAPARFLLRSTDWMARTALPLLSPGATR